MHFNKKKKEKKKWPRGGEPHREGAVRRRGGGGVRACARARGGRGPEEAAGGARARRPGGVRRAARESSACGDGDGVRWLENSAAPPLLSLSPPCERCVREGEGAAVYRRRVIGPGPRQRPGPLTHCSQADGTPGTYDAH